jgi:hypothetical protein
MPLPEDVRTVFLGGLFVLAVPMLGIAKIVCDDLPPLHAFGHFLEG